MNSTLTTCASAATRPASPSVGDTLYQVDTQQIIIWDGTAWLLYDSGGSSPNDSDITSLNPHLWLDPSYSSSFFTDSGKGTPVTADGSRVGCFADRSGNGFDYTQSTQGNKPILCKLSGGDVSTLCYSNTDQLDFVGTVGSEISAGDVTIFWVWRLSPEGNHFFLQGTANTNEPRLRINGASGSLRYNWQPFGSAQGAGGGVTFSTSIVTDASIASRHIYCLRTSSSANRTYSYQNGGADIAGATTAPTGLYLENGQTSKMFAGNLNYYSPHWLFEHIVFDTSLSDSNVNQVISYLGAKHGIGVTAIS